jgi:hypothetical protein
MKNTILRAKRELEKNPTNIIFGKIKEGNSLISEQGVYYDFLRNADGLRAGAIDLWGYEDLFGDKYCIIVPDCIEDRWYKFIKRDTE